MAGNKEMLPNKLYNKKRFGKGLSKVQRNQQRKNIKSGEKGGIENDSSRSLNSSRWRSWHNSIRDIDRPHGEKEWTGHSSNRYETEHMRQMYYQPPIPHYFQGPSHHGRAGHTSLSIANAPSFHMELSEAEWGHPASSFVELQSDQELETFLTKIYQTMEIVLTTHAADAHTRAERARQVATDQWLLTRTPEEREQYLHRQRAVEKTAT